MSERNPYVGPNGEASPEPAPMPEWTPEQMEQAEAELRDVLQRQHDMAVAMATQPPHGMPADTAGKYAARAYLLERLLHPVRYVLPMEDPVTPEMLKAYGRIMVLPEQERPAPVPPRRRVHRCLTCDCWVSVQHIGGNQECRDLQAERHEKNRDD